MEKLIVKYWSEKDENGVPYQDLKYARLGDACVDIRTIEDVIILPRTKHIIKTGLHVSIPEGYEIQVRPRSGISFKTDLIFKNTIGTIDTYYKDEIMVILYNLNETQSISFSKKDRIAQIKVSPVPLVEYFLVDTLEEIKNDGINRGGGFGHTGLQ